MRLCANRGSIEYAGLPWHDDWASVVFLVYAAVQSRRDWVIDRPIQIAAWAFVLSLMSGAFFRELKGWLAHAPDAIGNSGLIPVPEDAYVLIIGILSVIALGALVSSIRTRMAQHDR